MTGRDHVCVPCEPEFLLQQQPILNDGEVGEGGESDKSCEVASDAAVQMSAGEVLEL